MRETLRTSNGKPPAHDRRKADKRDRSPRGPASQRMADPARARATIGKASGNEAPRQRAGRSGSIDDVIGKALAGQVDVTPAKAVEMAGRLYGRGQFEPASRVCRQVIAARPGNADAHNILGAALAASGPVEEAIQSIKRAIRINPHASSYHSNLGEILRQAKRAEEAEAALREAVRLDPGNPQALNSLGIIQFEQGNFSAAEDHYRRALQALPEMSEASNNLGNALRMTGDLEGAVLAYQDALTNREHYPEAYNNLGTLLQQDKRPIEAEHALRKAIQQNPRYIEAHNNLALLLQEQGQDVEALRVLGDALKLAPKTVSTLLITARVQLRRTNLRLAEQAARLALDEEPENPDALILLGQILHETDRYDEAIDALERALKARPESPEALNFYGVALKSVGRLDEARDNILKALKLNDGMYGGYANLNDLVDFSSEIGEELFNCMEATLESVPDREGDRFIPLHFAFAKALDDRGEHERALERYIIGGRLKRATLDYREEETFGFFDAIQGSFPREVFEDRKHPGLDDDRPVFIVGMPRSGSTLVEQILSSHPDIHGAGEVKYFSNALGALRDRFPSLPKYPGMAGAMTPAQLDIVARSYQQSLGNGAGDSRRITDKLLTNYFFLGMINLTFPNARVIHTLRDPVDTCLSGFTKLFKDDMPHTYDLAELGRYYGRYRELMEHWEKVLPEGFMTTVRYEDVVADTEKQAKRLVAFLGLDWDDKCVEFHKSDRPVRTASVVQIRKPIYGTSVQRWRKYGAGLDPLIKGLAAVRGSRDGPRARRRPAV
ncbi:MAG TPA: sulfotransferase [Sphingomicrobium sp.]|nr:sulfotransferase [Sphingomicrobium sp.]